MAGRDRRSADDEFDRDADRGADAAADDAYGDDAFDDALDEDDFDEGEPAQRASRRSVGGAAAAGRPATRSRPVARPKAKEEVRPGPIGRIVTFIREVVAELQKVIWPTRKELITYTVVVIVFVSIVMTYVALLDVGFAKLMFLVFGGGGSDAGASPQ